MVINISLLFINRILLLNAFILFFPFMWFVEIQLIELTPHNNNYQTHEASLPNSFFSGSSAHQITIEYHFHHHYLQVNIDQSISPVLMIDPTYALTTLPSLNRFFIHSTIHVCSISWLIASIQLIWNELKHYLYFYFNWISIFTITHSTNFLFHY